MNNNTFTVWCYLPSLDEWVPVRDGGGEKYEYGCLREASAVAADQIYNLGYTRAQVRRNGVPIICTHSAGQDC